MQDRHTVPTPLDTLIAQLDAIARRYSVQPWQAPACTLPLSVHAPLYRKSHDSTQQETSELADAVAQALQDGAL